MVSLYEYYGSTTSSSLTRERVCGRGTSRATTSIATPSRSTLTTTTTMTSLTLSTMKRTTMTMSPSSRLPRVVRALEDQQEQRHQPRPARAVASLHHLHLRNSCVPSKAAMASRHCSTLQALAAVGWEEDQAPSLAWAAAQQPAAWATEDMRSLARLLVRSGASTKPTRLPRSRPCKVAATCPPVTTSCMAARVSRGLVSDSVIAHRAESRVARLSHSDHAALCA